MAELAFLGKDFATSQDDYIRLIPEYVEASDLFVVLAPRCRHSNGLRCSFGSWTERGWCRLELWCKMMSASRFQMWEALCFAPLSDMPHVPHCSFACAFGTIVAASAEREVNVKMPVVLISGSDQINFAMPMHWIDHPPHEGQFTIEADRHSVINVTREALSQKMSSSKASKKWDVYRYFVARYETLSGHGFRQRTKDEFLKDFNFSSLHSATNRCMSPMACAVLSADAEMIRVLCSEGLDVNRHGVGKLGWLQILDMCDAAVRGVIPRVEVNLFKSKMSCATIPFCSCSVKALQ